MKQFILCFFFLCIGFISCNSINDNGNNNDEQINNSWFESGKGKLIKNIYKMIVIKVQENTETVGGIKSSINNKVNDHLEKRRSIYNKNGGNEFTYLKSKISEKSKYIKKGVKQKVFGLKKFAEENYKQVDDALRRNNHRQV